MYAQLTGDVRTWAMIPDSVIIKKCLIEIVSTTSVRIGDVLGSDVL